jgi:hypothetical protein
VGPAAAVRRRRSTTRARGIGIDKAARSGITTAEAVLGRRLEALAGTMRY